MSVDLDTLKKTVLDVTKASTIASQVTDVKLEPDRDEDGTEFLRVVVELKNSDQSKDEDFEAFIEAVERAMGDLDDRYPSVRFANAA